MTLDDDPELERLTVAAREALDRFHCLTDFPAEVAAAAVDAYRDRKRREAES